jgi:hypothetical protein
MERGPYSEVGDAGRARQPVSGGRSLCVPKAFVSVYSANRRLAVLPRGH